MFIVFKKEISQSETVPFGVTCLSLFFPYFFLSILSLWANGPIQIKGFLLTLYRF